MTNIPIITLATFLSDLEKDTPAVSKPVRVLGSDANEYILKTQMIYDEKEQKYINLDCSFINEFLAYCIGDFIGVPQPKIAIAYIHKEFLDENPELFFNNRFKVGNHFASEYKEGSISNLKKDYLLLREAGKKYLTDPWNKFFGNLSNPEKVPFIIAFDFFIANKDRFAHPSNFLLIGEESNKNTLYAIDHGHAFGSPFWNTEKLTYLIHAENLPMDHYVQWFVNQFFFYNQRAANSNIFKLNGFGDIFKALDKYIDLTDLNNHSFIEPVNRIKQINSSIIDQWLNQIPSEWFVDEKNQKIFYKKFILHQVNAITHIIQYVALTSGFENYLGGNLSWNKRNTGIQ